MRLFFLLLHILLLNLFVNGLLQKDLPDQTLELHSEHVRQNAGCAVFKAEQTVLRRRTSCRRGSQKGLFDMSLSPQHAHALELLKDQLVEGAKALDVGSGSGYLTACFARMVSSGPRSCLPAIGSLLQLARDFCGEARRWDKGGNSSRISL